MWTLKLLWYTVSLRCPQKHSFFSSSCLPGPLDSVTSKSMSCLVSVASVAMVTAHLGCGERRRKHADAVIILTAGGVVVKILKEQVWAFCQGEKETAERSGKGHWLFTVLKLQLDFMSCFLFCSPTPVALSTKKLGFVSSCRTALGDWGTIKPRHVFKAKWALWGHSVVACWCRKGGTKKSAVHLKWQHTAKMQIVPTLQIKKDL